MTTVHTDDRRVVTRDDRQSAFPATAGERELFGLLAISFVVMWTTVFLLHRSAGLVLHVGDNRAYLDVANAIIHWNFRDLQVQHFMGYPYFIAAVSLLFHVPSAFALWFIAVVSAVLSVWFAARLFGTLVAQYFAFTNFAWLQVASLGGSEPLAMALGLGSLLAFRRNRVLVSALLASLSVTVRPLMFFVLVGRGVVLLYRRRFGEFLGAFGIGLGIGILYVLPLARYFGDPFLTLHTYTTRDYGGAKTVGPHGHLFGWPFHGIVAGTLAYPAPWTNLVLSFIWIGLVLLGVGMMFSGEFRKYAKTHPNEVIFCGFYLLAIFSYDYLIWARSSFIRFAIPALPFVFLALTPLLPRNRKLLWLLCIVSSVLSMVSAVGLRNVIP
jgi:hypothetical protein